MSKATLVLEDGSEFPGRAFGAARSTAGEMVFSTGMVGYPESMTDPSFRGQLLVFTYPLVGNYGVPGDETDELGLPRWFESHAVHTAGIVVSTLSHDTSHWAAKRSLHQWMVEQDVPGIEGIDTRLLAKRLRQKGAMLGKIVVDDQESAWVDPNQTNLVAEVSPPEPVAYGSDGPRVVLVDTGCKLSILRGLVAAGTRVLRVPWDYDFFNEEFDGVFLSNGPGNPTMAEATVANTRKVLEQKIPLFGVCLGNQILALAAGAKTYKMKFGHRSQNQPCLEVGTRRCYVTSQNHGYAVNGATLPEGWREWFVNANDRTNEGIRHEWINARSVQFHPEATPGPTDTEFLFRRFREGMQ